MSLPIHVELGVGLLRYSIPRNDVPFNDIVNRLSRQHYRPVADYLALLLDNIYIKPTWEWLTRTVPTVPATLDIIRGGIYRAYSVTENLTVASVENN